MRQTTVLLIIYVKYPMQATEYLILLNLSLHYV